MKYIPLKIALLYSCFLGSIPMLFSQGITSDGGQVVSSSNIGFLGGDHLPDSFLQSAKKVLLYKNIEGSPYINNNSGIKEDLPIGKLYSNQNAYLGTSFVRYNAYTDQMEISLVDDGVDYYHLVKKPDFIYIVLRKKKYRAYTYGKELHFFVIISESDTTNCTLLKKEKVLFKKETSPESSFLSATPASFKRVKDSYYLKFADGSIASVPSKNKDFLKLFPKHKDRIKAYISEEKLKIKKEADLVKIATYFDTLSP